MKQFYSLFLVLLSFSFMSQAQNTVEVDANAEFLGYANVFETPANGGAFVFGDSWGVPDLKTVVDAGGGTITLQPNFNTYGDNPTDPFWVDQNTLEGNKTFEGNTFLEDNSLAGSELTFNGYCMSNTIDAGYAVTAFIKVFNADFSVLKIETADLVAGQNFSINYTNVEGADTVVQYGFSVTGINANPVDESALGSVVVTAPVLGVNDFEALTVSAFPNPTNSQWNINSGNQSMTSIEVFNVLGKKVRSLSVNSNSATINAADLANGLYIANISTATTQKTLQLVKK